ncbi:cyclin pas1/pho80 domain containing 1 [Plakobranchus ocellatus]|uniref:Protein CNPPD1 n=1 Tax=Plakobranchus ocellatus TaxID=259542 RepID=A0AAV3ZYE1_9GAST|nr:cyclin pas1/pho80 domain containing 1 [Plakobranchus ocellatus]
MGISSEKRLDAKFRKRLRRRLHYGDMADLDAPSLPLTELAVDYFHDSAPGKLGHVDLEAASNIVKDNNVTPCSMVVSVLYAKRLRQRNKKYLDTMSSSDVFFISMMMASKYMYDEGTDDEVYNDEWAVSIDQDVCDVNRMEMNFLQAMDWQLFVRPDEFEQALDAIEKRLALQEGLKRGWFTYAELDVLMGPDLIGSILSGVGSEFTKLLVSLSAAYVTSLLSMLGSVVLATQVSGPLSSATVALMALHSSPSGLILGGHSSLLPVPSLCGDGGGSGHCQDPSGLEDSMQVVELDPLDANRTDQRERSPEGLPPIVYEEMQRAMLFYDTSQDPIYPREEQRPETDASEEGNGERGEEVESLGTQRSREREEPAEMPPARQVSSSLWSLLFLDSLLSQIWSLSTHAASKRSSCLVKKKESLSSNEDFADSEESSVPDKSQNNLCSGPEKTVFCPRLGGGLTQRCSQSSAGKRKGQKDAFVWSSCPQRRKRLHHVIPTHSMQSIRETGGSQEGTNDNHGNFVSTCICEGLLNGLTQPCHRGALSSGYLTVSNKHGCSINHNYISNYGLRFLGSQHQPRSNSVKYDGFFSNHLSNPFNTYSSGSGISAHEISSDSSGGDVTFVSHHQMYTSEVETQPYFFNIPAQLFAG